MYLYRNQCRKFFNLKKKKKRPFWPSTMLWEGQIQNCKGERGHPASQWDQLKKNTGDQWGGLSPPGSPSNSKMCQPLGHLYELIYFGLKKLN